MNIITKTAIAATAVIATAIVPVASGFAQAEAAPVSGKQVHKGGHYHNKKGPKVYYPRGYYKGQPPVVVHKNNNGVAAGLIGFAAGAIVGNALANNR